VTLYDVGPRDGLQNEPEILEVGVRAELVDGLAETGLPGIEVASFVDPRRFRRWRAPRRSSPPSARARA
jgi:isopropylmalate/homocitrate/citramalate synthase